MPQSKTLFQNHRRNMSFLPQLLKAFSKVSRCCTRLSELSKALDRSNTHPPKYLEGTSIQAWFTDV